MADEKIISIKIQTDAETKDIAALQTRLVKLTKQRNDLNKKIRDGVTLTAKEKQALGQLQPELVATRNKLRDMERQVVKNNKALKKNSGFVAGVRKGMTQMAASAVGFVAVFAAITKVVGSAVNIVKDFDKSQGSLRAVTGKTTEELAELTQQAKILGATTAFTATQATEAQIELAKLGFTVQEITELTPSVLSLAAATGTDLANAATIAGSTVRAFGLTAKDTQRVVDVMANSFTKSSLDIEKFKTAMGNVAPVAKSAGVGVEETTALIGTLTDAGIDASTAGTGLRNVFLELAKSGQTFEEAMEEIQNSTNKNSTALDLFGKRGATIGTVLAANTAHTKELTEALNESAGAAEKMANEQLNTLEGKLTILNSAWEGFVLSIVDGSSHIGDAFSFIVEHATNLLTVFRHIFGKASGMENRLKAFANLLITVVLKPVEALVKVFNRLGQAFGFEGIDTNIVDKLSFKLEELKTSTEGVTDATDKQSESIVKLTEEQKKQLAETEKQIEADKKAAKAKEDLIKKLLKEESDKIKAREAAEKFALDQENEFRQNSLENEKSLLKEKTEAKKSEWDIQLDDLEEYHEDVNELENKQIDKEIKLQTDKQEAINNAKQAAVQAGLDGVSDAIGVAFDAQTRKAERAANAEIQILNNKLDKAEISEEDYRKEVDKIREAQFEKEKKQAIIENTLNSAVAFMKSAAEYGFTPALGVAGAGLGAALIAQNAIVSAQQYEPVEFAEGGLLQGPSHAGGGIPMTVNGQSGFEAEGGEAIINKKSTAMFLPLLSRLNEAGGGVSFTKPLGARKFAVGGLTPNVAPTTGNNDLINAINSRIDRMQVVNVASDTAAVAGRVQNIESDASFG